MDEFHGLLVIDKPTGITSRDAVDRAQGWFPRKTRIGHTGTLDPLANGVLVLCLGATTRLTEYVQAMPKIYGAGITFGATSDSDDADGAITPTVGASEPTREEVERALSTFIGNVEQVPPAYSAAKVGGRRAYKLARKGQEFVLAPRVVSIQRIDAVAYEYPRLEIVVHCGKGTYIRSLARDLGKRLGCGGYIDKLRRQAIGAFTEAEAISLNATMTIARERLLPTWRAIQEQPPIVLSDVDADKLGHGQSIAVPVGVPAEGEIVVTDGASRFLAVVKIVEGRLRPSRVLCGR